MISILSALVLISSGIAAEPVGIRHQEAASLDRDIGFSKTMDSVSDKEATELREKANSHAVWSHGLISRPEITKFIIKNYGTRLKIIGRELRPAELRNIDNRKCMPGENVYELRFPQRDGGECSVNFTLGGCGDESEADKLEIDDKSLSCSS